MEDGTLVALKGWKRMNEDSSVFGFKQFANELLLMSSIQHPNLVNLHGICRIDEKLCMVMELCSFPDLMKSLQEKTFPLPLKVKVALDVARG